VIIGSGYIGLEVAEALVTRGLQVTILERSNSVLEGLEPEIEQRIEQALRAHNVQLRKGAEAKSILGAGDGPGTRIVYGTSGMEPADVIVMSAGIRPRVELAEAAGIALGSTGAIATDERMQTNLPSHYAAGDCAEVRNLVTGKADYFPLGTTANKQGRVAGENAAGGRAQFEGIVGTLVTKFFELELARTGLSVAQARAHGFDPDQVTVNAYTRAKYFGGKKLTLTLVWDRSSERLLGCQIAGEDGAAKRIDAAAMALQARMRVRDLLYADLAYAPPFAPVWEALLVAANEARKKSSR
jgi:NADPH-dependent 2,4-dienoyl-CoA reductase/sulfur reductase-like enzyme